MRPPTLRPAAALAEGKPHGTRVKYMGGCRCLRCRAANSSYEVERREARARGEGAERIPAAEAREHLFRLSRRGVGRRTVSELSGVSETCIIRIKNGKKRQIRATTARAILAVQPKATAPGVLVPAETTWRLIDRLLDEGYTRGFIARQLGSRQKHPALQLDRQRVTKANALKVERVYRRLTA